MNKKALKHALMIAAIVIAAFTAAALTPAKAEAKTSETSVITNIAKVDFESRTNTHKLIAENEIPLAESPDNTGFNITIWLAVVSVAALMTGVVIYEELKYKKFGRY